MPIVRKVVFTAEEEVDRVQCNGCEKLQCAPGERYDQEEARGRRLGNFHIIELVGGYDSKYPGDMHSVEFVLCDDCARNVVKGLKLRPQHGSRNGARYDRDLLVDSTVPLTPEYMATPEGKATLALRGAYNLGYGAGRQGVRHTEVPYAASSSPNRWWLDGWHDAMCDQGDVAGLSAFREKVLAEHRTFRDEDTAQRQAWKAATPEQRRQMRADEARKNHFEDPPDTGLCACGQHWPHVIEVEDDGDV